MASPLSDSEAGSPTEDENDDLDVTSKPEHLATRPKPAPPEWIQDVLAAHNKCRSVHWTPPLIWSEMCYEYAKRHADTCMSKGKLQHGLNDTVQGRLGQCCVGPGGPWKMNRPGTAEKIVDQWYKEIGSYRFDRPAHHEDSANFEQVVWFGTTSVGMAISRDGKYVVANYYPAGPDNRGEQPLETPAEKGRKNYFPPGHNVLKMTNPDKYHAWFKTNVRPAQKGPAPWLGGVVNRPDSPDRPDSPGSGGKMGRRAASPKSKSKKDGKKGKSTSKTPGRPNSRKSVSPGPGARKKTPDAKVEWKGMQPERKSNSRGRMASPDSSKSRPSSPDSPKRGKASPRSPKRGASRERKKA